MSGIYVLYMYMLHTMYYTMYVLHYVYIHYVIYYIMQYNTLCNIIQYVYIYNINNLTICRLGYVYSSRMYTTL